MMGAFGWEDLISVGAAEGCDLLILIFSDKKFAAFGSS
jgi:hypothetical protein